MRAFTVPRRYERVLPVLLAIVVASAVTVAVALLILPGANRGGNDVLKPPPPAAAEVDSAATPAVRADTTAGTPAATVPANSAASTLSDPTPTVRGIRRPTAIPSPTPTRGPEFGANLVVDGGFTDALTHWYTENDTSVVAGAGRRGGPAAKIGQGGGYADQQIAVVAGRTYRLQAWGRVSSQGDAGTIGIMYYDDSGTRLGSEEPPPLVVNETALTRLTFNFTPPANAATTRLYLWKSSGSADFFVDDVSVREYLTPNGSTPATG